MLVSVQWLNRHLDPADLSTEEAERVLTHAGFPIEGEERVGTDTQLDVEMTSNRGDCLAHYGLAREVSAATRRRLVLPACPLSPVGERVEDVTSVDNRVPDACPRFTARLVRGVKVGPSPAWLVSLLESIGQHSINNVVDVSNYILWEIGHPNHVFDFDALAGRRIVVRYAEEGETLVTLDDQRCTLRSSELVVADAEKAVSLAGVIGGRDSGVSERTTNVLLEMATWDPVTIRTAARRLNIVTDAGYRFERYVDARDLEWASERAAAMLADVCGGEVLSGMIDEGAALPERTRITLRPQRCRAIIGADIPTKDMCAHLRSLDIEAEGDDEALACVVPHHRHDLTREIDLIEEVGRVHGLEAVEVSPRLEINLDLPHPEQWRHREQAGRIIGQTLTGLGFYETVTFSFLPGEQAEAFCCPGLRLLRVSEERRKDSPYLRPSVIPSLLTCRRANQDARVEVQGGIRLFEIASVYAEQDDGQVFGRATVEHRNLALLLDVAPESGATAHERLQAGARMVRGAIERVARALGGPGVVVETREVDESERGPVFPILAGQTSAGVAINGEHAGYLAVVKPEAVGAWGLAVPVAIAEINVGVLTALYPAQATAHELPRFPAIERDLSVVVDEAVAWARIESIVRGCEPALLEDLSFVGVFRSEKVGSGRKSVTLRMHFRDPDRTLRHDEVDPQVGLVVERLRSELGADLRAGAA